MIEAPLTVAAVQAAPIFLDRDATAAEAAELIATAARAGARLVVFPEAFLPGYPAWVWAVSPGETRTLRSLYTELLANAVSYPDDPALRVLGRAAREAGVSVAIGVSERNVEASGTSLYNTLIYIDEQGRVVGRHRKLVPTGGERLVWAQGDGSTLAVIDLAVGCVGGLICWENYMPLARYALYAWGARIYLAPTWDRGEPWLSTLRHIAKEGRVYVIGCCTAQRADQIPDRHAWKASLPLTEGWVNPGDSAIVDPDGKFVAGPVRLREEILYATVDPAMIAGPRGQLDVAGHYARPDVFRLTVDRRPRTLIGVVEGGDREREVVAAAAAQGGA
jgi:nitrilase